MKRGIAILTLMSMIALTLFGQEIKKCDGIILKKTSDKLGKLTKNDIREFLLTQDEECRKNTQFSETNNELLFALLHRQTEMTLKVMESDEQKIKMNEILDGLSSPVNDMIDVSSLIYKVKKVQVNQRLKTEILERLKAADEKIKKGR